MNSARAILQHTYTCARTRVHTHTHTHTYTYTHTHTYTHRHTQAPAHTSVVTIQNLIYAQLKTGSKQRLETDEDSSTEQKAWQVYSFGKINVLRFDLDVSRHGFWLRGRGRSFPHVERPKTEKAQDSTVPKGLVRGIWRLRGSEAERRGWEGV